MKYKHWEIVDSMPEGWKIDKTSGSPLHGYEFVTNGKSPLNGQKRALLKIHKVTTKNNCDQDQISVETKTQITKSKNGWTFDESACKTVNELARKRCQERLLNDIMVDLMICEIEGWVKTDYINELKKIIGGLLNNKSIAINAEKRNADQGKLF